MGTYHWALVIHSQENNKSLTTNLDYPELILSEKSGSLSFVIKAKKLSLEEFNFTTLFLNWKIKLLANQVNEKVNFSLWVNDAAIFLIVIREDLRIHLCFCWNWKSLKVLADLTHLAVSILGQDLFQVGTWDNDATLPDAVLVSSVVGYSFQKCLFEIIL